MAKFAAPHFVKEVPEVSNWKKDYKFVLVESLEQLQEICRGEHKYVSYDTETSSLDPETGFMVGFSFSFDGKTGYYVPVNHIVPPSLGRAAIGVFLPVLLSTPHVFMFNSRFDIRFTEFELYRMEQEGWKFNIPRGVNGRPSLEQVKVLDTAECLFAADSNQKMPNLKGEERRYLGWRADTFEETIGDSANFHQTDPHDSYVYAGADALGTFNLVKPAMTYFLEGKLASKINQECLYAIMTMEDNGIRVDPEYLEAQIDGIEEEIRSTNQKIYDMVGYPFKLGSPKQLGDALISLGLNTEAFTKKGEMKVSIDALEIMNRKTPHPIVDLLVRSSKLDKYLNSYIRPLAGYAREKEGRCRFAYHTTLVPTARLASGADKKNSYFTHMNIQAQPKPHPHFYYPAETIEQTTHSVLGHNFAYDPTQNSKVTIESTSHVENLRSAYLPEEDCWWVSIDYSGQELRIIANYSNDEDWIHTFLTGGDIHKAVAYKIWGKDGYNKERRKQAKIANFAMCYGANAYTLKDKIGFATLEEAQKFEQEYKQGNPNLFAFLESKIREGRKTGTVYNYLGYPRRVRGYFQSDDYHCRSFAKRTCMNTPVQSIGAFLIKVAITRLHRRILSDPDLKGCKLLNTIHDEVNLSVPKSLGEKGIIKLADCFYIKLPGWPVPFECSVEVGERWGSCFPFLIKNDPNDPENKDKRFLEPKWEEYKPTEVQESHKVETIQEEDFDI